MREKQLLLFLILAISVLLNSTSCSHHGLNNEDARNDNAVVRIYVGLNSNKLNREFEVADVEKILAEHFDGATLQEGTGHYIGETEKNLIITIINCCRWEVSEEIFQNKIKKLITQLKKELGQESILVEYLSSGNTEVFEIYE